MLETILFWISLWFVTGVGAQLILSLASGIMNRTWPIKFNDALLFFLAGIFGFLSVIQLIGFILVGLGKLIVEACGKIEEDNPEEDETEEEVLIIQGLNSDEYIKVRNFAQELVSNRPKEETENVE
jgi:hypothetical protein